MFLLLTAIFFFCFYFLLKFFRKKEGLFSTFGIFSIIYIFYNVLIPLECYITNDYSLYGNDQTINFTYTSLCMVMGFNTLGMLGFAAGYHITHFNPYVSNKLRRILPKRKMSIGTPILGVLSILLILILYRSELQSSNSYEGNYTATYENPVYALLVKYFLFYLAVSSAFYMHVKKKLNITSIIFLVVGIAFGLYTSSKAQILILAIALLSLLVIKPPRNIVRFIVGTGGLFLLMAVINVGFGYYRFDKKAKFSADDLSNNSISVLKGGVFKSTDARGPMFVLGTILNKNDDELEYGSGYIQLFTIIVPKVLWEDRPYDQAEEFARKNMANWSPGQGLGYSFLVEGYVNFGIIGVFIHFLLFGLIWGGIWAGTKKFMLKYSSVEYWYAFYFTVGTYILFLVHRNTFAGSVKTIFLYLIPFLIMSRIFKARKIKNASTVGAQLQSSEK